jgi:hypothetical protein
MIATAIILASITIYNGLTKINDTLKNKNESDNI